VKALQLIRGGAFPPDVLRVIFDAFDDAWAEVSMDVSIRASAVETARLSLATIVAWESIAGEVGSNPLAVEGHV
jgi:hypothetical protein